MTFEKVIAAPQYRANRSKYYDLVTALIECGPSPQGTQGVVLTMENGVKYPLSAIEQHMCTRHRHGECGFLLLHSRSLGDGRVYLWTTERKP